MIEAGEIRIGNNFTRKLHSSRGLEYDHEFVITENSMGKLFSDDNRSMQLKDLSPIPITEELFVSLGGRTISEGIFEIQGVILAYITSDEHFQFEYLGASKKTKWGITDIKYVHQLQNLIFDITGNNFNIKNAMARKPKQNH